MIDVPVLVKDALKEGSYKKNYRIEVLDDNDAVDFTIDNDYLVKESVSIDERMCSGDTIKFGLCEGSSLEFQYFDKPSILDRRLRVYLDAYYSVNSTELTQLNTIFAVIDSGSYQIIVPAGTPSFEIEQHRGSMPTPTIEVPFINAVQTITIDNLESGDEIEIESSHALIVEVKRANNSAFLMLHSIPMGYFTVDKISRQASTGIIKVTAYNKLQSKYLDEKANSLIKETFGDLDSVFATDIIDVLLKEYAINTAVISTEGVSTSGVQTNAETGYSYKYANLYGDRGIFSAGGLMRAYYSNGATFTTSTSCKMGISSSWKEYNFASHDYPVRVRFNDDFDDIDSKIASLVNESLEANFSNSNSAAMKNVLATQQWESGGQLVGTKGWYLHIEVLYLDGTREFYGKTLFEKGLARGTFADLNKITLNNVNKIYLVYPMGIWLQTNTNYGIISRNFATSATDFTYSYFINSTYYPSNYEQRNKHIPKFSNGDDLTYQYYPQHMSVGQVLNLNSADMISVDIDELPDITLRELQSAIFETQCQYGQIDRQTDLFIGVELNRAKLYPQATLYPASNLYPGGSHISGEKSMYSKLWADEGNVHKWKYLIITYKGLDQGGNEVEKTLQRTINADGTDNYNMSDNWLFRNLVWAAEDVGAYADAMVAKMQNITWFPFEMWAAGLPYLETGDEIEIPLGEDTYTSYILQRTLKGIQNLQDTYINGTLDIF